MCRNCGCDAARAAPDDHHHDDAHGRAGGPPWTTDADEIVRLFGQRFAIEHLMPARDSIERRRGNELFARLRRR